jgi:hypothetical protein
MTNKHVKPIRSFVHCTTFFNIFFLRMKIVLGLQEAALGDDLVCGYSCCQALTVDVVYEFHG